MTNRDHIRRDAQATEKHPPAVVRANCQEFLGALETYRRLLEEKWFNQPHVGRDTSLARARRVWRLLEKYGKPLVAAARAWNMTVWVRGRQEWRLERGPFPEPSGDRSANGLRAIFFLPWEESLRRFLSWSAKRGAPFGFSDNDLNLCDPFIGTGDIRRAIRALMAAASEREHGTVADIRRPLSDRESQVLDLIPVGPDRAISGKEIIKELGISQSVLTTHVIPHLKTRHGVRNRRGSGYYRLPTDRPMPM